jgi:hypothetical protein
MLKGNIDSAVRTTRINHDNLVAKRQAVEAGRQLRGRIQGNQGG